MKQKILLIILLMLIVPVVLSATIPFNQCIRVLDAYTGQPVTTLDCYFSDSAGFYNSSSMSNTGGGFYCQYLNASYLNGTYDFTSICTDGLLNTSVSGSFVVGIENITSETIFETNVCPVDTTPKSIIYGIILIMTIVMIIIGIIGNSPLFSTIGGLILIFTYFQLVNCFHAIAMILMFLGILSFGYGAMMGLFGKKE